jgi:chitodextrinase
MKRLITTALLVMCSVLSSQNGTPLWKLSTKNSTSKSINKTELPLKYLFDLDSSALKNELASAPKRNFTNSTSNTIISLPNGEGKLENFRVYENSVMDPILAAKYPEIKSYVAVGIDNPSARAYFSNSPLGFKSMTLYADQSAVFIEPVTSDLSTYTIYKKSDKKASLDTFECSAVDQMVINTKKTTTTSTVARYAADDGKLRTLRLALSCTGEYAAYFGGSKALTLASMNNTVTRISGVFERDFGIKLILVANNDALIQTAPITDPYSDFSSKANWKPENQSYLDTTIGSANYDIGHLLGAGTGNCGDAGGVGSVCIDLSKGRGYTCAYSGNYQGDAFDIQFVAHEMGHQLGAFHTFTYQTEGTIAQLEPGSGSTIMSYGGASMKDYQDHRDTYFHAISIQQVTDLIKTKSCPVVLSTGNAIPVVNAGLDYSIPKGTPFLLTGTATDANTEDALTYTWEEMDLGNATTTVPSAVAITGPLFRSYSPSTSATRYFPNMTTVLAGLTTTPGLYIPSEVLPGVARTLNFRLTVRDNRAGGSANNTDDMMITVDGNSGPFTVDSQNTAITYAAGTSQTINWTVAGTNANGVNCSNVTILLSTNGGQTFPITLLSATPNTGTANVVIPNSAGTTNRIMVKGTNQIFFDVNNVNFTITGSGTDTIAPTTSTLSATGTTTSSINLSWTVADDNVGVTGYNVYQNGVLKTTTTATSLAVAGLNASTTYSFYIVGKDAAGNSSAASNTVNVTTLAPADTTAPTTSILSASGTTTSSTNLSWTVATDNVGVKGYNVYQNGVLKTTTTATSLAVAGLNASTTYSFYIVAKDAAGNSSAASNTVNITTLAPADTTAPTTSILSATGTTTSSTNLSWTVATDNVGVKGYNVYQNGVLKTTTTATTLAVARLNTSATYSFYIVAKDVAGNSSAISNIIAITTLSTAKIGPIYCSSYGSSTAREYINKVQIGTISNVSGNNNGYGDFTLIATSLAKGTSNTIIITPAWNGAAVNETYRVWIDFNQDGDFDDSGELVYSKSKTKTTTVSGSLVIPTTALTGSTRMRVAMKYNALANPCEIFPYGEVEDYTVNITTGATARIAGSYEEDTTLSTKENTLENAKLSFKLYPNPVKENVIYISGIDSNPDYIIYNMLGIEVAKGNLETKSIAVGQLPNGTYIIQLNDGISACSKLFIKQ